MNWPLFVALRVAGALVSAAVALWVLGSAAMFGLMLLPPSTFARWIGKVPAGIVMGVLPFRPAWSLARAGSLNPGDPAPDFDLPTYDRSSRVRLSSLRGKPVVLVFGSYT